MISSSSIKIEGLKDLDRKLRELSAKLSRRALRQAVGAGGKIVLAEMRANTPRGRGREQKSKKNMGHRLHLQDDLRSTVKLQGTGATAEIGPRKLAFVVNLFERTGAKPHLIVSKRAKALFVPGQGFVTSVEHPGFSKRPFMLRSFQRSYQRAIEAMRAKLQQSIEQFTGR